MNVIVLVVDRLHCGYLGAYGNTWIDTPAFDRLAAESFLFDQAWIDSPELGALYASYWQGKHALAPASPSGLVTLPALLREAGLRTTFLTDDRTLSRHPLAVEFDERVEIELPPEPQIAPEGSYEETHLARCFAEMIDTLERAEQPFLLWGHVASLGVVWDAPPDFRLRYCEEGDPQPPMDTQPPDLILPKESNPDVALGISKSYAGQIKLLDMFLESLTSTLAESTWAKETLFVLTSARGFPLGEHRRIGPADDALYGELVHVPLLVRLPDGTGAAGRSQALVGPTDLWATLLDLAGIAVPSAPTAMSLAPILRGEQTTGHDRLCIAGRNGERAIRTPAWYLRQTTPPELYAKPDDHWESNDVYPRCRDIADGLEQALDQWQIAIETGRLDGLPPMDGAIAENIA